MKYWNTIWIVMCYLLILLVFVESETTHTNIQETVNIDRQLSKARIEKLEQEIRLLKTDLYIMQNGYEGGNENGKD